jgi:DNA-binding CsgD family transcriptional regulator
VNSIPGPRLKAFSEAVERIHQETDLERFPQNVFEAIESLIPDVVISIDEFNSNTGTARSMLNRPAKDTDSWPQRLRELVPIEHPVFPVILAGGRDARQVSEFLTERQFRLTSLYHDVFHPLGVRHQIVLPLFVPDHVAGITISRWRKFQAEEVAFAQMLASHIALAHVHAQRFTALLRLQKQLAPTPTTLRRDGITKREAEVLHWIVQGKRDSEISVILGASVRTIHKHVQRLLEKLGVETRTAAALRAIEMGFSEDQRA